MFLSLLFSILVYADVKVTPPSPAVSLDDVVLGNQQLSGPYFGFALVPSESGTNFAAQTIDYVVTASDGKMLTGSFTDSQCTQINDHSIADVMFIGSLPPTENYKYKVDIKLSGWDGLCTQPAPIEQKSFSFSTH